MKIFFAGLTLFVASSAFAAEAPVLKEGVDAEVKAAIEAAQSANKEAKAMDVEWYWAKPLRGMWKGSGKTSSKVLQQAIEMANDGKNDAAKTLANFIAQSAKEGVAQAEKAKKAGPAAYGL